MEETVLEKILHTLAFLAVCAGIVFVGWHEPLRYRFMSSQQIADEVAESQPPPPAPPVRVGSDGWHPGGTALDRSPYEVTQGKVKYSTDFDPRKMGAPTETDRRSNTTGKQ